MRVLQLPLQVNKSTQVSLLSPILLEPGHLLERKNSGFGDAETAP